MAITGYTFDHLDDLNLDELFSMSELLERDISRDYLDAQTVERWRSVRREIARRLKPLKAMVESALKPLA